MAKLKAPLMSLGASGKLADTLVFFPWKGLNVVREYVVPTYRRTSLQATQRDYVKAAVAKIHEAQARAANPLDEEDQVAYSALAAAKGLIMTWFNMAVKLWVDTERLAKCPIVYSDGTTTDPTHTSINLAVQINERTATALNNGKFWLGSSKTSLIHSKVASLSDGAYVYLTDEDCSAFMSAGIIYFWQFKPDAADPCEGANSGIYSFKAT